MPSLHGPLPPLEQETLLSLRLLHAGRSPSEPLDNLPAVLERDNTVFNGVLLSLYEVLKTSTDPLTHTWLLSCFEEPLLSL